MSQGKVFVDASFWITRRDKRDERQTFAEAVAHDLFRRRLSLVSTSFVFAEVHAYFSRSRLVGQVVIYDFFETLSISCIEFFNSKIVKLWRVARLKVRSK